MEKTKKGQFIELDFTAKIIQTDTVFDTTLKKHAKLVKLSEDKINPWIVCIGENMVLKGLDKELEGKEIGKEYSINLKSKDAFGERKANLVKIIPLNVFKSKGVMPYPGLSLNMDGMVARISAVSGGRVITDFNNPLFGKDIQYDFKIKRILTDTKEKLQCLADYFLKGDTSKQINQEGDKITVETKMKWPPKFIEQISKKMSNLLGKEIIVKNV